MVFATKLKNLGARNLLDHSILSQRLCMTTYRQILKRARRLFGAFQYYEEVLLFFVPDIWNHLKYGHVELQMEIGEDKLSRQDPEVITCDKRINATHDSGIFQEILLNAYCCKINLHSDEPIPDISLLSLETHIIRAKTSLF